jgi:hypothetical protein
MGTHDSLQRHGRQLRLSIAVGTALWSLATNRIRWSFRSAVMTPQNNPLTTPPREWNKQFASTRDHWDAFSERTTTWTLSEAVFYTPL